MPFFQSMNASTGKVALSNPELSFVSYGSRAYGLDAVINIQFRPAQTGQLFPYKQNVEWYGRITTSDGLMTQLGNEFLITTNYTNSYQSAQFFSLQTSYSMVAGTTYWLLVRPKSLGVFGSSTYISLVAKTLPQNPSSVTASVPSANTVQASWSAANGGGDSSITYIWALYKDGSFYASGQTTSTVISYPSAPAGQYFYIIYSQNTVGSNASSVTSNTVTVSAATSGRRCTSLNVSRGLCFTINCCYNGPASGSVCSPATYC